MFKVCTSLTPAQDAARHVHELLLEHRHADVLLLLSGGSALALLNHIDTSLLSERVTISVLDERYTLDEQMSNFSQLTKTVFFERACKQHVQVIDPRPEEDEDLLDATRRFDLALKHWHITHHDGVVIATMGIGADGHTAGILPHPNNPETFTELFHHQTRCVKGYHVDQRVSPYQDRMTVTNTYLLRHVDYAIAYVVGEEKRSALEAVYAKDGELHKTPARILNSMQDVALYTDISLSAYSES
jgi:6-phosphogluconolactonase/glucosamine-6-phosphate isomerase/deaminase